MNINILKEFKIFFLKKLINIVIRNFNIDFFIKHDVQGFGQRMGGHHFIEPIYFITLIYRVTRC